MLEPCLKTTTTTTTEDTLPLGTPQEKGRKDCRRQTGQVHQENRHQLSRAHGGSQRLKQQPHSLHGSVLGPLHVCYSCVAWCFCETPNSGIGGVSDSFACSWDPFSTGGLTLSWYLVTSYDMFSWYHWEAFSFWEETEEEWIWGVGWELEEVEGGKAVVQMQCMREE